MITGCVQKQTHWFICGKIQGKCEEWFGSSKFLLNLCCAWYCKSCFAPLFCELALKHTFTCKYCTVIFLIFEWLSQLKVSWNYIILESIAVNENKNILKTKQNNRIPLTNNKPPPPPLTPYYWPSSSFDARCKSLLYMTVWTHLPSSLSGWFHFSLLCFTVIHVVVTKLN